MGLGVSSCPRALVLGRHGLCGQDTAPARAAPVGPSGCAQRALQPGPAGRGGTVWLSVASAQAVGPGRRGWPQRPAVPPRARAQASVRPAGPQEAK